MSGILYGRKRRRRPSSGCTRRGLPAAREVSAAYTAALKESAEKETGWCRFRDRIFLPLVIDGAIWMTGKMLERMTAPHSVK